MEFVRLLPWESSMVRTTVILFSVFLCIFSFVDTTCAGRIAETDETISVHKNISTTPQGSGVPQTAFGIECPQRGVINASRVNLRSTPGLTGKIVTVMAKGVIVTVNGFQGQWVEVETVQETGWIYGQYITITEDVTPAAGGNKSTGSSDTITATETKTDDLDTPLLPSERVASREKTTEALPLRGGEIDAGTAEEKQVRGTKMPPQETEPAGIEVETTTIQELPEEAIVPTLQLSLKEAITIALKKNYNIIIEQITPSITETGIEKEKATFDPTMTSELTHDRSASKTSVAEKIKGSAEISKKFETGTKLTLTYEVSDTTEPRATDRRDWDANLTLKFTQDLLKNFGTDINLAKIRIAEKLTEQSQADFIKQVIETVASVQEAYWDLSKNRKTLDIRRESYLLSKTLLQKKRTEAKLGAIATMDLIEIESDVASRIMDYVEAKKALRESEVNLKTILDMPLNFEGKPVEIRTSTEYNNEEIDRDFGLQMEITLNSHPEYQKLRLQEESKAIELDYYENQLLPNLEFNVSYGLKKYDEDWNGSMGLYGTGDDSDGLEKNNYEVGLKLSYPLDNRTAKADLLRRKLELRKIKAQKKQKELLLKRDLGNALITVEQNADIVRTSINNLTLKEKNMTAGQQKLTYGTSNIRTYLDTQTDFIDARLKVITARTDYEKALVNFYKVQGIVNPTFQIEILKDYLAYPASGKDQNND